MQKQNHQKKNTLENLWGSYVKNSQQWTKWVFWDYKGKMDQTLSSVLKTASLNVGIEPTTRRLRVSCSIDWASQATPVNHYQHFPSALRSTWIQVMREREGLCRHPCAHQFFWVCRLYIIPLQLCKCPRKQIYTRINYNILHVSSCPCQCPQQIVIKG